LNNIERRFKKMKKNSGLLIGGVIVAIIVIGLIAINISNMTGNVTQPRIVMRSYDGAAPVKIGLNNVYSKVGVTNVTKTSAVITLIGGVNDPSNYSESATVLKGYDNTQRIANFEVTIVSITYKNAGNTKSPSFVDLRLKKVA
jgi:hypothetical protein